MAEIQMRYGWPGKQLTYSVVEAVVGGQLVEARAVPGGADASKRYVGVAGEGSTAVRGIARWDVPATRASIQGKQVGDRDELTVARDGVGPVVASGAVGLADKLCAAAAGKVRAYVAGTDDPELIIGESYAPAAVADGATFDALIY